MRMDAGLDTGAVYATRDIPIATSDTTPLLTERLAVHGAGLLLEVLEALAAGTAVAMPQENALATLAPRLSREDGRIEWASASAVDVDRHVRALLPWPGTSVALGDKPVRLLAGEVSGDRAPAGLPPGEVVAAVGDSVDVATAEGVYRVAFVHPAGGRPMSAAAYLRGRRTAR
jgi:methionyl-tRNA formyltransferase